MPQIVAFAGPAGPAFSFSAFLLPVCSPSCVEGLAFSHPGSPLFWISCISLTPLYYTTFSPCQQFVNRAKF